MLPFRHLPIYLSVILVGSFLGWKHAENLNKKNQRKNPVVKLSNSVPPTTSSQLSSLGVFWPQIADDDFGKYLGNLRSIQCPNDAAKFIIRGVVMRLYQAKVNKVFNPLAHFWNSQVEANAIDKIIKLIREDRDKLLASLGVGFTDVDSLELPAEKQSFVTKAAQLYPVVKPKMGATKQEWASFQEGRRARVNYLSQHLSPDELLDYRINHDGNSQSIARLLQGVSPSDGEFKKAFEALDGEDVNRTNGFMRTDLEAKLKSALGDDRYAEYHQQTTYEALVYNNFVEFSGLSPEQNNKLKEMRATFGNSLESKYDKDYQQAVQDLIGSQPATRMYFNNPSLYQKPK